MAGTMCTGCKTCGVLLQVMQTRLSPGSFRVLTSLVRTLNNMLGGISFVVLAKVFGAQSSAGDQKKKSAKAASS